MIDNTTENAAYNACVYVPQHRYQPKCDVCGKFRKDDDLREVRGGVNRNGDDWQYYVTCRECEPSAFEATR